ncbi:MAG: hypothetical protein HQ582_11340 [Planctomycetes bacterium]|nr:hypothetical protein [Planctomycetota bacterium]
MPTGTSSPYYPDQPEPPVALEPDDSYLLVRLRDAQACFDGGILGRGGVLTVQSTVESSFRPGTPAQSIHQTALIKNSTPCRLGTCTNLTDWLPAYPDASLRVTLEYSLLPRSVFQGLAGLLDKLKPVAKLTLHDPEWAVALKVSETVARLMASAAGAAGQHELLSLVLDLNVADLKAGYHAVLGSCSEQIWPSALSINENRHLVADGNALARLCYALIEVLALKRLGPESVRGAPWWEVLQAGKNRALETPSPNDEQRKNAIDEWHTTLALARTLARNERGCLPNEANDLIRTSHVEVEAVLAPQTAAEGQLDDQLPSQWQRLLELTTGRELRSSTSRYRNALESSRRVLDQYGPMPALSPQLASM